MTTSADRDAGALLDVRPATAGREDRLGHALPRRVHGDPGRAPARVAREPRSGERDDAAGPEPLRRAQRHRHRRAALDFWARSTPSRTTRATPARARCCAAGDDARGQRSTRQSTSLQQLSTSETTQLGAIVAQINSTSSSLAQLNQSIQSGTVVGSQRNTLEDQRDQLAQQLAQLTGATIQRRPEQPGHGHARRAEPRRRRTSRRRSTLDTSGPTAVLRAAQGGFAVNVTSGQAGGMLNDINTVIPGYLRQLDSVATTLRDQVNSVTSPISGTIAAAATRPERGGHAAVRRRPRRRRVRHGVGRGRRLVGRGRRGRAADRAADRGRTPRSARATRPRPSPPTATARCRSSIAPTGTHALAGAGDRAPTPASRRCSATRRSAPTASAAGRSSPAPTRRRSRCRRWSPATRARSRRARPATGRSTASIALQLADMATSTTGADSAYNKLIVQLGVDAKDVQTRDNDPAAVGAEPRCGPDSQAGVNTDEEMTNMVEFQKATRPRPSSSRRSTRCSTR